MRRSARLTPLALIALLALPAIGHAQGDDAVPPPATCIKPVVPPPGTALDKAAAEKLNTESKAYSACGDAYMTARRAAADKHQQIANTQVGAANAFAAEFNGFAASLAAFSKAQADKAAKEKK